MSRVSAARQLTASFIAAIAAATIGCSAEDTGPIDFLSDTGGEATGAPAELRLVSRITTGEGATIEFLNENDPSDDPVISVKISSPASTPIIDALLAQQPSALELHLALRPGTEPPAELVREHRLLAAADPAYAAEPRALTAASVAGSNIVENFTCRNNYTGWRAAFNGWAPPLDGKYTTPSPTPEFGLTTGYVGYAPKFYFDVCRTDTNGLFAIAAQTQRRTNAVAAWAVHDGAALGPNQRYRFFRNSYTCTSYQWRLYVAAPLGGTYYRGATWADQWSCQISS